MNDGIFEGGFRRLPEQNLAGASKHTRKGDFLLKIHLDRVNRQLDIKKTECAIQIQAIVRGFLTRRRVKYFQLDKFVTNYTNCCNKELSLSELGNYLVTYFYLNHHEYDHILVWMTNQVIKFHLDIIKQFPINDSHWLWRIRWLLKVHLKKINWISGNVLPKNTIPQNLYLSMQALELFTNFEIICAIIGENAASVSLMKILLYTVKNGYYSASRNILHINDLQHLGTHDEVSISAYVQHIVQRPLNFITSCDITFGATVVQHICRSFLTEQISPQVKTIIFPIILAINNEAILRFIESIIDGGIEPSTSCLFVLVQFFQKGCCQALFTKVLEALSVLLGVISDHCPKVAHEPTLVEESILDVNTIEEDDYDEEYFSEMNPSIEFGCVNLEMLRDALKYIRSIDFSTDVLNCLETNYSEETLTHFSKFLYTLITKHPFTQYKILWYVSVKPIIYKDLWVMLSTMCRVLLDAKSITLLSLLSKGTFLMPKEAHVFYPILITFCLVFKRYICMLHTDEILENESSGMMSFSVATITEITVKLRDVAISLLNIGLPDTPIGVSEELKNCNIIGMKESLQAILRLLRVLHSREIGPDQSFWTSKRIAIPHSLPFLNDWTLLSKHALFDEKTLLDRSVITTNNAAKPFVILRDLPFCVPTKVRINLLQEIFILYKTQYQNPNTQFNQENMFVKIRRDYIYEDAFEKLSLHEVPEMKINIRIQLTSAMGYEEAGVDGGGIFREFMNEFLKSAFDPNRGFFLLNKNHQLYPNPNVEVLYKNFKKHYFFIGRMLAKALYENILVELPLAECFISSLVKRDSDVNLYDLHSLDPELFRNLISLRSYEGDFNNLGLNYTAVSDLYGQTKVTELISEGEKISVNRANKIDYIHTVADYKLNTQIEAQCSYFRQGVTSVFSIFWLAIFSAKELQKLIFCSDSPIDMKDLKNNCYYTGGYSSSHPNIIRFWNVFEVFGDIERRQLLKFVTSCSRQPLLGFKDLDPPFTIQLVESSDRLPTSSTCMNLLKLPIFQDESVMKEKLLYSIQSQAGFDLC